MARSRMYRRFRLAVTGAALMGSVALVGCGNMIDRVAEIGKEPSMDPIENPQKDPNYQPLPTAIVVRGNQHGKAGYAPAFDGGAQIAAAMGGAIPPVLWLRRARA